MCRRTFASREARYGLALLTRNERHHQIHSTRRSKPLALAPRDAGPEFRTHDLPSNWWTPFHTLKVELVHQRHWATRDEARRDLFAYVEGYYNRQRMHSALGYLSPEQAERKMAS
jgi:transposase InsO family protein